MAIINYNDLKTFGRDRVKVAWSMVNDETGEGDEGYAFIENLDITGNTDDFVKFTGTLTGYGAIVDYDLIQNVWYQNIDTFVDNGGQYVLLN
jgi:predicted secreted protein